MPPARQYSWERPKPRYKSRLTWYLLAGAAVFGLFVIREEEAPTFYVDDNSGFRRLSPEVITTPDITPFDLICPAENPPTHAKLHHNDVTKVVHYNRTYGETVKQWNAHPEFPEVLVLEDFYYAAWTSTSLKSEASAWSSGDRYVHGPGWSKPKISSESNLPVIRLVGNYVAFHTWALGLFGHFGHDWLPTIAFLRSITDPESIFLLVDHPTSRQYLSFLDPHFANNRVVWIKQDQVIRIEGNLTVQVPVDIPNVYGCCYGWDPLRQWIAEKHADRIPNEVVPQKHVLFYSRTNVNAAENGRALDPVLEEQLLAAIRSKLQQYGRGDVPVIRFSGEDAAGNVLPLVNQFALLRGASAWIGPHGGALGGNFAWLDPFVQTCEERPQILEFIPGRATAQLPLYASTFGNIRKWPLDYHTVLYTPNATDEFASIDLQQFNDALDAMWGSSSSTLDNTVVTTTGSTIEVE